MISDAPPAPRSKLGLLLWVCALSVVVLSVLVGIVMAAVGVGDFAALAIIIVPLAASALYTPLTIAALIASIVAIRQPGAATSREEELVILIGISTVISIAVAVLAVSLFSHPR